MIKITFLGTGCMMPTKERNLPSIALEYNGDIFLFDCAENTQLQIKKAKLHLGKMQNIFISHWHGDHVLGLPGLLQTLNNIEFLEEINIYGPIGTKKYLKNMLNSCIFTMHKKINITEIPKTKTPKTILDTKKYEIKCISLEHSVPTLGYLFEEKEQFNLYKSKLKELGLENNPLTKELKNKKDIKFNNQTIKWKEIGYYKEGKKIAIILDTLPSKNIKTLVKDSDYLIIESTLLHSEHKQNAIDTKHMTAKDAGIIAKKSNVKNLILTHFSQRYKDLSLLKEEAEKEFNNDVIVSEDLMVINVE